MHVTAQTSMMDVSRQKPALRLTCSEPMVCHRPQAYTDYIGILELTEDMIRACAAAVAAQQQVGAVTGNCAEAPGMLVHFAAPCGSGKA